MTPISLISHERARPILLAWAELLGDTLDSCPLPTPGQWVYFSSLANRCVKVGWTRFPDRRPFACWSPWREPGHSIRPLVFIRDAGLNVERMVKRAGRDYCFIDRRWKKPEREVFRKDSPVGDLVAELRAAAEGCWHQSEWFGVNSKLIERERARCAYRAKQSAKAA